MLKPRVEVHNIDGFLVAEFWDCLRLDPGAVQALRAKYEEHLRGKGRSEMVVDLLGVAFAGSASLGHFVALQRLGRLRNGRLVFCNVDPMVYEVFRATKLLPLFSFSTDRAAALAVLTGTSTPGSEPPPTATPGPAAETPPAASPSRKSDGDGLLRSSRRRKLS
jgi:anti-anti-sigma factor